MHVITPGSNYNVYPHFTDRETGAQKGWAGAQAGKAELGFKPRQPGSKVRA